MEKKKVTFEVIQNPNTGNILLTNNGKTVILPEVLHQSLHSFILELIKTQN